MLNEKKEYKLAFNFSYWALVLRSRKQTNVSVLSHCNTKQHRKLECNSQMSRVTK